MLSWLMVLCLTVNNNVDTHTVVRNAIGESECIIQTKKNFQTIPTEIINIEELTKQNDKIFDKNINTELLQNEFTSNVTLPEYNLCINTSENLNLKIPIMPNKEIGKNRNFCFMKNIYKKL